MGHSSLLTDGETTPILSQKRPIKRVLLQCPLNPRDPGLNVTSDDDSNIYPVIDIRKERVSMGYKLKKKKKLPKRSKFNTQRVTEGV